MEEIKENLSKPKFGSLFEISKDEFIPHVTV